MRIGIRLPPCAPIDVVAEAARRAEDAGFDDIWFPDSQLLWRDAFLTAAAAAANTTSRAHLGIAVANVVTRHPSVLASAARSVEEVAPGRFVLGVGVGNSSLRPIGMRPTSGAVLRERVGILRALLSGERVEFGDVSSRLRDPELVPIYIAASGPRNLRLAGEIGDGAIVLSGAATAPLTTAVRCVQEGASAHGRRPGSMIASAFCRVTDDLAADARELKPVCVAIAQAGGLESLATANVHVDVPTTLPSIAPDLLHAEDWDAAVRACDPYVSDDAILTFARSFCLFGTASEIVERIRHMRDAGADAVLLQHVGSYDLPDELVAAIGERVLPFTKTIT